MNENERPVEDFGAARAPARGRFRLFARSAMDGDGPPVTTIGLVDAGRDRSIQINLVPTRRRLLGLWQRPAVLKAAWACEGGKSWLLVDGGSGRVDVESFGDRPNLNDVLRPLRAVGPDLATALVLLRTEPEHTITVPPDDREVALTTTVDGRVLRVDVHSDRFPSPVFVAPADATDHDLLPDTWPPLAAGAAPGPEYARFVPPLWRAAADLLRDSCRPESS